MSEDIKNLLPEDPDEEFEEDIQIISLTLEDDTELDCMVASIFDVNDREYIALVPVDEEGEPTDPDSILFYRYDGTDEENPVLDNIEDDDELESVLDRFEELLDEMEFEDEEGEEDAGDEE